MHVVAKMMKLMIEIFGITIKKVFLIK